MEFQSFFYKVKSPFFIWNLLYLQYISYKMNSKKQDIAYFISFCIEQYMNEKKITGEK